MDSIRQWSELVPHAKPKLWFAFGVFAALGLFGGTIAKGGNAAAVVVASGFILFGLGAPACYWLWLANTRLLVGTGVVGYQDLLGRQRFWPCSEIARAVQLTIVYPSRYGEQAKQALLLVGADGRCLQKVRVANWSDDDIAAFAAATGRSWDYLGPYSPVEANREFPGSVGWMYAHPSWSAAIAAGIVVAIGAAVVLTHLTAPST